VVESGYHCLFVRFMRGPRPNLGLCDHVLLYLLYIRRELCLRPHGGGGTCGSDDNDDDPGRPPIFFIVILVVVTITLRPSKCHGHRRHGSSSSSSIVGVDVATNNNKCRGNGKGG
jgi:hypothetical protein